MCHDDIVMTIYCLQGSGWPMEKMWAKLNSGRTWYKADNEAYIYWNSLDSCWWIDKVTIIIIIMGFNTH